jgi:hypothetical protein
MRYAIMVKGYGGTEEFELCRVGTNPKAIVKAAYQKGYCWVEVRKNSLAR